MSDTIVTPAVSAPAPVVVKTAKAPRADYDQKLANDITVAATLITNALNDPAVLAALTYSEAEIREGLALQMAAQAAFAERQRALSAASAVLGQRDEVLDKVVDEFKAYRTSVQNTFPESAHTALGASGRLPADLQKLVTLVRSAYETARTSAYLPTLEKRKITGAILLARLADAESLERLDGQFKAADKGAAAATRARNLAGEAMRAWLGKFRKQAKSDLRNKPELQTKIGAESCETENDSGHVQIGNALADGGDRPRPHHLFRHLLYHLPLELRLNAKSLRATSRQCYQEPCGWLNFFVSLRLKSRRLKHLISCRR